MNPYIHTRLRHAAEMQSVPSFWVAPPGLGDSYKGHHYPATDCQVVWRRLVWSRARDSTRRACRWIQVNSLFVFAAGLLLTICVILLCLFFEHDEHTWHSEAHAIKLHAMSQLFVADSPGFSNCFHANEVGDESATAFVMISDRPTFVAAFTCHPCGPRRHNRVKHRAHRCAKGAYQTDEFSQCVDLTYSATNGSRLTTNLVDNEAYCAQHMQLISNARLIWPVCRLQDP